MTEEEKAREAKRQLNMAKLQAMKEAQAKNKEVAE